MLLLIQNEMLGAGNDTCILNTLDRLGDGYPGEDRIRAEALPVASALWVSPQRTNDGAELDIDTFASMLQTHLIASTIELATVPGCRDGASCSECGDIVGKSDTQRTVLRADTLKAETRDSSSIANTGFVSFRQKCLPRQWLTMLRLPSPHPWSD